MRHTELAPRIRLCISRAVERLHIGNDGLSLADAHYELEGASRDESEFFECEFIDDLVAVVCAALAEEDRPSTSKTKAQIMHDQLAELLGMSKDSEWEDLLDKIEHMYKVAS